MFGLKTKKRLKEIDIKLDKAIIKEIERVGIDINILCLVNPQDIKKYKYELIESFKKACMYAINKDDANKALYSLLTIFRLSRLSLSIYNFAIDLSCMCTLNLKDAVLNISTFVNKIKANQ